MRTDLKKLQCMLIFSIVNFLVLLAKMGVVHGVDHTANCFRGLNVSSWQSVVTYEESTASVDVEVGRLSAVAKCLKLQNFFYKFHIFHETKTVVSEKYYISILNSSQIPEIIKFRYLFFKGPYIMRISICKTFKVEDNRNFSNIEGALQLNDDSMMSHRMCGDQVAYVTAHVNHTSVNENCLKSNLKESESFKEKPISFIERNSAIFKIGFDPCSKLQFYDTAKVSLFKSDVRSECPNHLLDVVTLAIQPGWNESAFITFRSQNLDSSFWYCIQVRPLHPLCDENSNMSSCLIASIPVYMKPSDIFSNYLNCQHILHCLWIYILVLGVFLLFFSLFLACIFIKCCNCRKKLHYYEETSEQELDGINLCSLKRKISWSKVHCQFTDTCTLSNGKVFLLYSPDSEQFRKLQGAFKEFLENACHCDVYDIFDEKFFNTIALNPNEGLDHIIRQSDIKIIIVSSQGAYRRQEALKGEVLNLPENTPLDGLFSAALGYLQNHIDLSYERIISIQYENLNDTKYQLKDLGSYDFVVPSDLHKIFCWIHNLNITDLTGKPWHNYYVYLQNIEENIKKCKFSKHNY